MLVINLYLIIRTTLRKNLNGIDRMTVVEEYRAFGFLSNKLNVAGVPDHG